MTHLLSTHAGNPAPRWHIVFIALVFALAIGSAGQPVLAQEPDPDVSSQTVIQASIPQAICVGETGTVKVRAVRTLTELNRQGAPGWDMHMYRPGITINATSADEAIASLFQTSQITGFVLELPGEVEFDYRGEKEGTTQLTFTAPDLTGLVGETLYKKLSISVKVINCKFDVTTVLQFSTGFYNLTGISSDTVMIADEQGHLTGSASMSWAYSNVISGGGPCSYSMLAADSQVDLVGQLDKDGGQVMTTATFQPTTVSSTVDCGIATGTQLDSLATAHPLTFTVDSSGGVSTQTATAEGAQGALELEGQVSGTATIVVVPEDEAAAFSPDSRAALSPLAWWATLVDNFPWLFGALLALR